MKRLFYLLALVPTIGISQSTQIERDEIIDNQVSQIIYRFKSINALNEYDSLEIGAHQFNKFGLKTYKKLIYPFQDVVALSDQTSYNYQQDTILIQKIKTHNAVRLTSRDDSYINFFGIDYDTTIVDFKYYNHKLLKSEITYSNTSTDTIKKEYFYNDENKLTKLIQINTTHSGKLHQDNFKELYFYSEHGLLDSIQNHPSGFNSHSTEIYSYDTNHNIVEKRKVNGFSFTTIVNFNAANEVNVEQQYEKGAIEKNHYDENGRLTKTETGYYLNNKIDVIENYIYDNNDNLIEKYKENHSEDVFLLIDHQKFRYNKKGHLIAEEILKDKETQFEYLIEYK